MVGLDRWGVGIGVAGWARGQTEGEGLTSFLDKLRERNCRERERERDDDPTSSLKAKHHIFQIYLFVYV